MSRKVSKNRQRNIPQPTNISTVFVRENYTSVGFGNGIWLLGTGNGKIYRSTASDPLRGTWSFVSRPITSSIRWMIYASGPNIFVAISTSGVILTSPDGITWTSRTSGTTETLNKVRFLNGFFIILGNNGVILTSPDAVTWTLRTSGTTVQLNDVAYSPPKQLYCVVGQSGQIRTSPDLITWTQRTAPASHSLSSIVWAFNNFGAFKNPGGSFQNNGWFSSPDGLTWSHQTNSNPGYGFVAQAEFSSSSGRAHAFFTASGMSITDTTSLFSFGSSINSGPNFTSRPFSQAATNGTIWVQALSNGIISRRSSMTAGGTTLNPPTIGTIHEICFASNQFIALGNEINQRTANGITFTDMTDPSGFDVTTATTSGNLLAYSAGAVISHFPASPWTSGGTGQSGVGSGPYYCSCTGNGIFVFGGNVGNLATGPIQNAASYTLRTSGTTQQIVGLAFGNNIYVGFGSTGYYMTSPDAITWTSRTWPGPNVTKARFLNGAFYVTTVSGRILRSVDGLNWQFITTPISTRLNDIDFDSNLFVAVGNNNVVITSSDGDDWIPASVDNPGVGVNLTSVKNRNGIILIGTDNGSQFLRSPPVTPII
jgi:hypothetical protein